MKSWGGNVRWDFVTQQANFSSILQSPQIPPYSKVVLLRSTLSLPFTAVSDNTRPASSKSFQGLGVHVL